jgi:hypothetical protein
MFDDTPMGCGFFIFFQAEEPEGGSGFPYPIVFVHKREEKKTKKKIKKYLKRARKIESNVFSKDSVKKIADALVKEWNPNPSIEKLEIDYEEALRRYEEYILLYIQSIEDEELALLLIFAQI